jgi:hypothetical protein
MASNRITPGAAVLRALAAALAAIALAAGLGACGGGGSSTSAETASAAAEQEADVEVLHEILARQLGVVAAYPLGMRGTDLQTRTLLRRFRAQEGEHADGVVKALRGLRAGARVEPEAIEPTGPLKTHADRLRFLYAMESATIQAELTAVAKLSSPTARAVLASTVANQAQHLTILRRLLGSKPVETVPVPFETGNTPAP